MSPENYDVVVIGAGSAGLSAGITAAEHGATVLVLEKTRTAGGLIRGGSGLFAVESRVQKENQVALTRAEAFRIFMEFSHWRVDAALVSEYINRSADTIAWLESLGARFSDVVAYYTGAYRTWHFRDPDGPELADVLIAHAAKLGIEVRLETRADALLYDGVRVHGLSTEAGDRIEAGAVILATGSFSGDADLVRRHTGLTPGIDVYPFPAPAATGDGLRLARAAGAALGETTSETYVCLPEPFWGPGGTPPHLGSFRQPNLMVNQFGERFMDEQIMRHPAHAGNAVHRQPGGCAYMILDESAELHYREHGWDTVMSKLPVEESVDLAQAVATAQLIGYRHLFRAESVPELAEQTGIDPGALAETINAYNEACAIGRDEKFHKDPALLRPLTQGPYYAARFSLGSYGARGGIKINHRAETLDEAGRAIAGLYATGNDANTIYGGTYPFALSGNSSAFAYNSGRIAGEHSAAHAATIHEKSEQRS